MLRHLVRQQFPDRTWGAADLDAAAEFWLRLYESVSHARGFSADPHHDTEVRLRGFPRAAGAALVTELARRAGASDFVAPEVGLADPDTLFLASGATRADERQPVGLGVPLLAGEPFDGLLAEVRFRVAGRQGWFPWPTTVHSTLVLVGEVRGGTLLVKGVWRSGSTAWEDETYWTGPSPAEGRVLAGLDEFRRTGEVPVKLAKLMYQPRGTDRAGRFGLRCSVTPLGRPRLGGVLLRAAGFAAAGVGAGVAAYHLAEFGAVGVLFSLVLIAWVLILSGTFLSYELRLLFGLRRMLRAQYAAAYAEPANYVAVPRADADARFGNPWLRKWTAEAEAAGFRYAGDAARAAEARDLHRVFHAPDGVTYLVLRFLTATAGGPDIAVRVWPAAVLVQAHTYLAGGGRVESLAGRLVGYWAWPGPDALIRTFPDVTDPAELVRRHAEAAARFTDETGRSPLRHEGFEQFVRRQEAIHEEERQAFHDHPYSWADHLRWYIQSPRREVRG